jgi:hypothetical protein
MGTTPNPVSVYPDPGGGRANAYTPVNTNLQVVSIVSGAVATGAAAAGSGTAPGPTFLFLQAGRAGFLGFHAASGTYVAIAVIFGALSVLLSVINLVNGFRMKERLRALSEKVCAVCKTAGLFT